MRLVMMGTGTFAEPTFRALLAGPHPVVGLVTNPDRPSGRDRDMLRGMKKIALENNIPVYQPEKINTPEGIAQLTEWRPDLLVVAAYGQILSRDILQSAPLGGINVHASLLPKYRGAAPINWAIFHGETETGVTIIRMSVHLDAGDMLAQEATPIDPEETAGALEDRLAEIGARLATRVIEQWSAGPVPGFPQDPSLVTKAPKLTKEHGAIDWNKSAAQVCRQIRAMQPWPSAYTFWHQQDKSPLRLIVFRAVSVVADHSASPGSLLLQDPARLLVAAADGEAVELLEIQPAGKRRMSAGEFLRGHPARDSDCLGTEEGARG